MSTYIKIFSFSVLTSMILAISFISNPVNAEVRSIIFPVQGGGKYSNDFDAPRNLNGTHHATDIFANKHTPVLAAVDGRIGFVAYPQPSYGYYVQIIDDQGYKYNYIHINNDTPGTDNGSGGAMHAYGPDVKQGNKVVKGQLLGYLGDSGNAETTPPHLHFEIYNPAGEPVNPFDSLNMAQRYNTDARYPALTGEILPYSNTVSSSIDISVGNFDGEDRILVSTGPGSTPNIKLLNRDGSVFSSFMAYAQSYLGGMTVASGDIDGDGKDEIITGTRQGNTGNVRVFSTNGDLISEFMAYGSQYLTGATVASGDIDGDGKDEIITGTGPGNSTHVKVFNGDGAEKSNFFAYPGSLSGLDVAIGDVTGDGNQEIITSPGPGGGSTVSIFKPSGEIISSFMVYEGFYGGTRVTVGELVGSNGGAEIITSPWQNGGPDIRVYSIKGSLLSAKSTYEYWWSGRFDVAVDQNLILVATGENRRSSIRSINFNR